MFLSVCAAVYLLGGDMYIISNALWVMLMLQYDRYKYIRLNISSKAIFSCVCVCVCEFVYQNIILFSISFKMIYQINLCDKIYRMASIAQISI